MILYTDAMAEIIQTDPKQYGYGKIDVFPNKSELYAKETPRTDTIKRLCEISNIAEKCFMNASQKNIHVDMAIFVKDSDVEIFLYDSKVKEIDTMKGISFKTEIIGNL